MTSKKQTLSEKFAELINPTPCPNVDDDDFVHEDTAAKVVDSFDADSENEVESGLSSLRVRNSELLGLADERYAGEKVSRKSLRDSSEESSDDEEGEREKLSPMEKELDEESSASEASEDSQDQEGEEEDQDGAMFSDKEEQAKTDDGTFHHFSTMDKEAEVDKGNAVRSQLNLWDGILEFRIQLQKCLLVANQLPPPDNFNTFKSEGGKDFKSAQNSCSNKVTTLLESLLKLQKPTVATDDEEIPSSEDEKEEVDQEPPQKQRKLDDYSSVLGTQHSNFVAFRNATIQKWSDKTRMAQGRINSKNFSAFEQSTVKQIESVLDDKQRLIKRTRNKRSAYRILGRQEKSTEKTGEEADKSQEYSPEIFDDDDFYHQLLRELIEHKCEGVTDPIQLGRQWIALQKIRSKMKRKIDTRATKGRKIRYVVHPKLVNFMAPYDKCMWTDESKTELFRSLFAA
ncbi:hypothetical protein B566_EDAN017818 [Ephemera danica]|nr:hypothetical protein B566_EDAN017818 [Ephemera danica]